MARNRSRRSRSRRAEEPQDPVDVLTDKLHLRARKFAALGVAEGNEGDQARIRLRKLIDKHPVLAYLDVDDPMGQVTRTLEGPHITRRLVLRELCNRYQVRVAEDAQTFHLVGKHADVEAVLQRAQKLTVRLDRFLYAATVAWLTLAQLPKPLPRTEAEQQQDEAEAEAEEDEDVPEVVPLDPVVEPEPLDKGITKLLMRAARTLFSRDAQHSP